MLIYGTTRQKNTSTIIALIRSPAFELISFPNDHPLNFPSIHRSNCVRNDPLISS